MARVAVHGLGYIGLPTAALLAEAGHDVLGCDIAPAVVERVNRGVSGFREPGLDEFLARAHATGRLRAATTPAPAEFHLVAVPTPFAEDHRPDLSCVDAAADALAPVLRAGDCVILESTVPVGATEAMAARISAARPDLDVPGDIHVAHCPERVIPGRTLHELVHNDRVIGGLGPGCAARAASLYRSVVKGALLETDCRTAELVKLAENAFRDVNIAFANELAAIARRFGVDPWGAIALANRHPRVEILSPGAGVGGHCIAVDPWFLVHGAPEEARLIRTAREVNDAVPADVVARVKRAASGLASPRIACLGLAYKPDADDVRESPAVKIVRALAAEGLAVTAADPFLETAPAGVAFAGVAEAIAGVDVVVMLVAHTPFRALDPAALEGKLVLDVAGALAGGRQA
ncbi:UDP-N-acetyl-D-mannosamine dehydrogenase [Falsiroseomonas sp. HW251]|uniref:UDP-N-acetyl-D-mannosamine dehydrogenase n=1 Tax=Falsiroseomonas sp. HW251 TaxID=3390998 RepID=UPI003D3141C7